MIGGRRLHSVWKCSLLQQNALDQLRIEHFGVYCLLNDSMVQNVLSWEYCRQLRSLSLNDLPPLLLHWFRNLLYNVLLNNFILLLALLISYIWILLLVKLMKHILVHLLHLSLHWHLFRHLHDLILVQHRLGEYFVLLYQLLSVSET